MSNKTGLSEQLEQYILTAKGQIARSRTVGEIAGYAAAVGAGLAMAGNAEASIIYSGTQNFSAISVEINPAAQATISSPSSFYTFNNKTANGMIATIDLDGDGHNDVSLGVGFFGTRSQSPAKYYGYAGLFAANGAKFLGTSNRFFGASNLIASKNSVGTEGSFLARSAGRFKSQLVPPPLSSGGNPVPSVSVGNFAPGVTGFVGIQLTTGNYGWIRLRLDDSGLNQPFRDLLLPDPPLGDGQGYPDKVTVIDWAYENTGAAIHVGNTKDPTIPEPSSLALLAAGAAGLATFRRRKVRQAQSG